MAIKNIVVYLVNVKYIESLVAQNQQKPNMKKLVEIGKNILEGYVLFAGERNSPNMIV